MKLKQLSAIAAAVAVSITTLSLPVSAQEERGRDRGDRGDRGNPEEFRQRMAERMKTMLKVSDEEWAVLNPLIEKVQSKQREAMGSRFGGFGGRGGDRGGDRGGASSASTRPGAAESQALRTTLENENASPDELKAKLTAVREQRKKSQAELEQAREDLRKVLTVRQEAALVSMGLLE
jgi:Spy/CpxP family protein refolding chaperone